MIEIKSIKPDKVEILIHEKYQVIEKEDKDKNKTVEKKSESACKKTC
jgi:hypothetical protein